MLLLGGAQRPPPTPPAPRNLHFISDTSACNEINILKVNSRLKGANTSNQPYMPPVLDMLFLFIVSLLTAPNCCDR